MGLFVRFLPMLVPVLVTPAVCMILIGAGLTRQAMIGAMVGYPVYLWAMNRDIAIHDAETVRRKERR